MRPTRVFNIPIREDLRKSHNFKIGDRVRHTAEHWNSKVDEKYQTGTVAMLPSGPVVELGTHVIGNELSVDLDGGGRAVASVDWWEHVI